MEINVGESEGGREREGEGGTGRELKTGKWITFFIIYLFIYLLIFKFRCYSKSSNEK